MKMGKKVREYKTGDFIFAKVKGYPAWPARVQGLNGKKYFVYFYGTGETANLPPNMIFDYAEFKDKFLTKTVKRKDFNLGVKQIEHDFANNVPVEEVVGTALISQNISVNDTINESTGNYTLDESAATDADTTAANNTTIEDTIKTTQNDTGVDDSDETSGLVIDEGKKGRKSTKGTKQVKEPKTPRGKAKKEEHKEEVEEKKEEEIISRSGRKIRPKRYIDEQTEENTTLPSPAPKKRRVPSPAPEKEKEPEKEKPKPDAAAAKSKTDKTKLFNTVSQSELEDMKEPFVQEDADKENILIAYLANGQYVGIRLFQSRPASFKNEAGRLQWDKQAASNAINLKLQLERGQITPQSVMGQLVTDLHLTDEEKATLDKERETEEKKSRVQFLKTEMNLIDLDAKIKTCLCLEKADTELCLKLLDELMKLDVKPLMLLKHPSCLETMKRMRAYIGNTNSWDLSESAALLFNKQAQRIRDQADILYKNMKELFTTPAGLSFFEYFSERVLEFEKVTANLTPDELLEMVHEPLEMSTPTQRTTKTQQLPKEDESPEDDNTKNKNNTPAKAKKPNGTQAKSPLKRQSSRKQQLEEKETTKEIEETPEPATNERPEEESKDADTEQNVTEESAPETATEETTEQTENTETEKEPETKEKSPNPSVKDSEKSPKKSEEEKPQKKTEEEKPQKKTEDKVEEVKEKEKQDVDEPRAKRSRESKKTEPPSPRSPSKRKQKF